MKAQTSKIKIAFCIKIRNKKARVETNEKSAPKKELEYKNSKTCRKGVDLDEIDQNPYAKKTGFVEVIDSNKKLQKDEAIKKDYVYYKSKVKHYIIKNFYVAGNQPAALTLEGTYADKMMS